MVRPEILPLSDFFTGFNQNSSSRQPVSNPPKPLVGSIIAKLLHCWDIISHFSGKEEAKDCCDMRLVVASWEKNMNILRASIFRLGFLRERARERERERESGTDLIYR